MIRSRRRRVVDGGQVMRARLTWSLIVLLATAACSGSTTTPSTTTGPVVTAHGSMSATVDGTRWDASATLLPTVALGQVGVGGSDAFANYTAVSFAVPAVVGTYSLGTAAGDRGSASVHFTTATRDMLWSLTYGGSGSITLTTLTAAGASGTFSFTLGPQPPTTGTKVVTNGVFNVTF